MTPPLRPIPPLLNFATLRWGSSSRLRAFHIQRYLSNDTKSANEEFADRHRHWILERRELLARLSFPRKYMPIWKATWWTARRFPWVLIVLIFSVVRVGLRRAWNPRYWKNHGVLVTSHAGCFFYKAVQDHLDLLNTMMQPWGYISISCGPSMLPTVSAEPAIHYSSYAYTNKRDVKRGDVVMVIGRNYNKWDGQGTMGKRVAALGGERIRVNTSTALRIPHQIIQVGSPYVTSSLINVFTDSYYRYRWGTAFLLEATLQSLQTQERSVRCRLNLYGLKRDGPGALTGFTG